MPANRLPWVKFWHEALDHEKFAVLSDGEAWTWMVMLAKASQQPKRWRFASIEHAHRVTGRPVKHMRRLIAVRLIDECSDGLAIHDARQWQDSANLPPSMREHSANGDPTLIEPPPNGDRTLILNGVNSDREGEGDREVELERDEEPPAPTGQPPTLRVLSNRSAQVIDALRATGPDVALSKRDHAAIKDSTAAPGQIAAAYRAVESGEYGDDFMRKRLSVHEAIEWVNGYQCWLAKQQPLQLVEQPELEAGPMCRRCGQHEQDPRPTSNPDLAGLCGLCAIMTRQELRGLRPVG